MALSHCEISDAVLVLIWKLASAMPMNDTKDIGITLLMPLSLNSFHPGYIVKVNLQIVICLGYE